MNVLSVSIFLLVHVEESMFREMTLFKEDNPYTSLFTSSLWTSYYLTPSIIECAMRCLEQNNTCNAIEFDANTALCTSGKCAITQPVMKSASTYLYQSRFNSCGSTPDFKIETSNHTSACLWWSSTSKPFTDASADCLSKGATLGTFKTYEKVQLLRYKPFRIYVGLDDIDVEGVYRWHDDNSIMDLEKMRPMIYGGEFFILNDDQDCGAFYENTQQFHDHTCSWSEMYVCEKTCYTN